MVSENLKKIRMSEKVGYASGDFACNLIYATVSTYLLFFYTVCLWIISSSSRDDVFGGSGHRCACRSVYWGDG